MPQFDLTTIGTVKNIILDDGSLTYQIEPSEDFTAADIEQMLTGAYRILECSDNALLLQTALHSTERQG